MILHLLKNYQKRRGGSLLQHLITINSRASCRRFSYKPSKKPPHRPATRDENVSKRGLWYRFILSALVATLGSFVLAEHIPRRTTPLDQQLTNVNFSNNSLSQRKHFNFINNVVDQCAAGVVYIQIQDPVRLSEDFDEPLILSNGSGFVIREDGWVLTNAHVVISKANAIIKVMMTDGTWYPATLQDADLNVDLALIKVDCQGKKLPALRFAQQGDVKVGEWVVALGSPLSLSHCVVAGIVSSISRTADELGLLNNLRYIQTDAQITFGNSGGPLVNLDGQVIGVNNLRITSGISFAIPTEYVQRFLSHSREYSGARPLNNTETILGMTTLNMSPVFLEELVKIHKDYSEGVTHGVFVWKLLDSGVAKANGLQVGDIITAVNGNTVRASSDIYKFFMGDCLPPQLEFQVIRQGRTVDIKFQLPHKY